VRTVRIDDLLEEARSGLERLSPADAHAAVQAGAVLIDIRDQAQAALDGAIPGAVGVPRNVLEWRCAPDSAWRDERLSDPARLVIVICDEGYQSSLAAATLKRLGLTRATDVDGGFQAWRAAGLPVTR
jgi:rhodanese-related sulfurtransferase